MAPPLVSFLTDFFFSSYSGNLKVLLMGVDLDENLNKTIRMDWLNPVDDFELAPGVGPTLIALEHQDRTGIGVGSGCADENIGVVARGAGTHLRSTYYATHSYICK